MKWKLKETPISFFYETIWPRHRSGITFQNFTRAKWNPTTVLSAVCFVVPHETIKQNAIRSDPNNLLVQKLLKTDNSLEIFIFRLPGEAMQIDRVMDAFAAHYCAQNPNIFEERDTCFILSFSIIMLNTALHNPNAKMKITSEQFIKQNKGINSGRDLASDMLEAIFRNIKEEPFKIPDETYDDLMYTFFSPEREGWLMKQVILKDFLKR